MSQKGITINTLDEGHVDASDHALIFNAIFGKNGILDVGNKLSLSRLDNNKVRMLDGMYIMQNGVIIRVENFEDLEVESGTLGKKRIDLVIAEYVKNGQTTGNDVAKIKVVSGEYSDDNPVIPQLINNSTTIQEKIATLLIDSTDMTIQSFDATVLKSLRSTLKFVSEDDGIVHVEIDDE